MHSQQGPPSGCCSTRAPHVHRPRSTHSARASVHADRFFLMLYRTTNKRSGKAEKSTPPGAHSSFQHSSATDARTFPVHAGTHSTSLPFPHAHVHTRSIIQPTTQNPSIRGAHSLVGMTPLRARRGLAQRATSRCTAARGVLAQRMSSRIDTNSGSAWRKTWGFDEGAGQVWGPIKIQGLRGCRVGRSRVLGGWEEQEVGKPGEGVGASTGFGESRARRMSSSIDTNSGSAWRKAWGFDNGGQGLGLGSLENTGVGA